VVRCPVKGDWPTSHSLPHWPPFVLSSIGNNDACHKSSLYTTHIEGMISAWKLIASDIDYDDGRLLDRFHSCEVTDSYMRTHRRRPSNVSCVGGEVVSGGSGT